MSKEIINEIICNNYNSPYRIILYEIDKQLEEKFKLLDHKQKCTICNREFYSHKVGKFWVQTCGFCDLYVTCSNKNCNKENLILDHPSRVLENIKNNKLSCCDNKCLSKAKLQQNNNKICNICGSSNFNIMGICMNCHNKSINKSIICKIHGYQEKTIGGKCIYCINESQNERLKQLAIKNCEKANNGFWKSEEGLQLKSKIIKQNGFINEKFCLKCNLNTKHRGNTCLICNPNAFGHLIPNFITKNNIRYYKGIEVHEFANKILSGELDINNYPGINIRFGEVYYKYENIITGEINKFNNSDFYVKDKELWYYDQSIKDYIPWEEYKSKFKIYNQDFQLPSEFKFYSTFRTQDSEDWLGARQAFEQSLIDEDISWFAYIKFYITPGDDKIKPLVVGKSGSKLVNTNGSDVSFSMNVIDGLARRFLQENNYEWDKTKIAIYKCKNEEEALRVEKEIQEKYNLFGS